MVVQRVLPRRSIPKLRRFINSSGIHWSADSCTCSLVWYYLYSTSWPGANGESVMMKHQKKKRWGYAGNDAWHFLTDYR